MSATSRRMTRVCGAGRAIKDGKKVDVSLDYQGNVIQAGAQGTTAPSNAAQGGSGR